MNLVFTGLVDGTLIKLVQIGYDATREREETPPSNLLGEVIVEIIHQENMYFLPMRNVEEASHKSDRFMDA